MKPHLLLRSADPPHAGDPFERMLADHRRAGVPVGVTGLRVPAAAACPAPAAKASSRRTKLWELTAMLHCSVIGTCLPNGELRALLRRADPTIDPEATDHDLHSFAVAAAARNDAVSKRIHKALERRHNLAIDRFSRADSAEDLCRYWDEAMRSGDLPGAYWAVLTHPLATDAVARRAFGDLHMLSHRVGAANRAELQKLHWLEQQKSALEDKLERQQAHLREAIVSRDARIAELGAALAARLERGRADPADSAAGSAEVAAFEGVVSDLRKRLDLEVRRRERAEKRAGALAADRAAEGDARAALERELAVLREEAAAAEDALAALSGEGSGEGPRDWDLAGLSILYVGGRPHQAARLRMVIERAGGRLAHHDGGIEQADDLLPGLVSRADVAVFPVDCVSHAAAQSVKRLSRQAGKRFVPLRSGGIASLLRAVRAACAAQAPAPGGDR